MLLLSRQGSDKLFDPEQENARAPDQEVGRGCGDERICSCENPAPENAGNEGGESKPAADMQMSSREQKVGDQDRPEPAI